jgi:hypothetical protein
MEANCQCGTQERRDLLLPDMACWEGFPYQYVSYLILATLLFQFVMCVGIDSVVIQYTNLLTI